LARQCASEPQLIAQVIRKRAPAAKRVAFETGPLSVWFFHALTTEGVPAISIDARHAKAALDMAANKTDANDADGLAHLAEVGFYREVRVKSFDSMLARTLVAARTRLVRIGTELSNQIRELMTTFGLIVPPAMGSKFERHVEAPLADNADLGGIIRPLLEAWHAVRIRAAELGRQLLADARRSESCQLLMSIPGVGVVTATTFITAIEDRSISGRRVVRELTDLIAERGKPGMIVSDNVLCREAAADFSQQISRRRQPSARHAF
jgi:transposase